MKWKDSSSCAKYKTKQSNERTFEFARDINATINIQNT